MGARESFDPLGDLRAAGLAVTLDAGKLVVRPKSTITEAARVSIVANRPGIVAALEAERAELTALVAEVCAAYACPSDEVADTLRVALADPAAALTSFRNLARDLPRSTRPATAPTNCDQPDTLPVCNRCRHRAAIAARAGYFVALDYNPCDRGAGCAGI